MRLTISKELIGQIHTHGEQAYPEEGAGLLLGRANGGTREVGLVLPLANAREEASRYNRYLITPQDMLAADRVAEEHKLEVIGVFHSHPDHPNRPSDFDREWALPWFSYLITSVQGGTAQASCSWRLSDDRSNFLEEEIVTED